MFCTFSVFFGRFASRKINKIIIFLEKKKKVKEARL